MLKEQLNFHKRNLTILHIVVNALFFLDNKKRNKKRRALVTIRKVDKYKHRIRMLMITNVTSNWKYIIFQKFRVYSEISLIITIKTVVSKWKISKNENSVSSLSESARIIKK